MTLTKEQQQALQKGESIRIEVDGTRCVLIREDLYDEASPRASYAAVLKALDKDDESPEQYLEYLDE